MSQRNDDGLIRSFQSYRVFCKLYLSLLCQFLITQNFECNKNVSLILIPIILGVNFRFNLLYWCLYRCGINFWSSPFQKSKIINISDLSFILSLHLYLSCCRFIHSLAILLLFFWHSFHRLWPDLDTLVQAHLCTFGLIVHQKCLGQKLKDIIFLKWSLLLGVVKHFDSICGLPKFQ